MGPRRVAVCDANPSDPGVAGRGHRLPGATTACALVACCGESNRGSQPRKSGAETLLESPWRGQHPPAGPSPVDAAGPRHTRTPLISQVHRCGGLPIRSVLPDHGLQLTKRVVDLVVPQGMPRLRRLIINRGDGHLVDEVFQLQSNAPSRWTKIHHEPLDVFAHVVA